jgi:hypothetical protein
VGIGGREGREGERGERCAVGGFGGVGGEEVGEDGRCEGEQVVGDEGVGRGTEDDAAEVDGVDVCGGGREAGGGEEVEAGEVGVTESESAKGDAGHDGVGGRCGDVASGGVGGGRLGVEGEEAVDDENRAAFEVVRCELHVASWLPGEDGGVRGFARRS